MKPGPGSTQKSDSGSFRSAVSQQQKIRAALENEPWFRGLLGRDDMAAVLKEEGDFIVRITEVKQEPKFVVSVVVTGGPPPTVKHFIIQNSKEKGFWVKPGSYFPTIKDLVNHYLSGKKSLVGPEKPGIFILRPAPVADWELKHEQIQLGTVLGDGAFGEVRKAQLVRNGKAVGVAVKTCKKEQVLKDDKDKFLKEARLIRNLQHPHIVKLIGVCADQDPLMIVLELAPNGSLDRYLREKGAKVTQKQRLQFCLEAGRGMEYLEISGVIHRDLAARNCLLGANTDIKISDFGLSRDVKVYSLTANRKVPIKWSAPETLRSGQYMGASDVWSFGVLVWEIFSNAAEPYAGLHNKEVQRKVLKDKYRLPAPSGTPGFMAELMSKCWIEKPQERPKFSAIVKMVEGGGTKNN